MPALAMPRLSDSMEEGTILRWLVSDGAVVARGEEIVEIETDKANMAYEADVAGVLAIVAPEGATVAVGAPIAHVLAEGEEAPVGGAVLDGGARAVFGQDGGGGGGVGVGAPAAPGVSASPLARRVAARLGVALGAVVGSGPRGRIVKADVTRAAAAGVGGADAVPAAEAPAVAAPAAAAPGAIGGRGATAEVPLSRLQQTVARRMAESKATVPDFVVEVDVDMGEAIALRAQLKAIHTPAPSVNDLIVRAAGLTLRAHPRVNGSYRDGAFELHERVNVGVAVATDDGLVVPTIFDADRRPLTEIAAETRRLAERVRSGTITPPELAGGTFTVSNLGMLGVDRFSGVVNLPQAAILCVGTLARRPAVADDGAIVAREQMTLTLVSDHRILYGADAARFLADLRTALEQPLRLLA